MATQEFLAKIADFYTPALLLIALGLCVYQNLKSQFQDWLYLLLSALLVYGFMFADKTWHWWSALGLDYSTHTAAAFALVVFIARHLHSRGSKYGLLLSFAAYGCLMFYLDYHTWADMTTTGVVIAMGLWAVYRIRFRSALA